MTTSPVPAVSPLASVRSSRRSAPERILLIGVEGVGKSTFGASAPAPIFIAAEDGIRHLDVPCFPEPRSFADVIAACRSLATERHAYQTLVLDTIDWIEPLIIADLCRERKWMSGSTPDIEAPGYGKGWVAATEEWRKLLFALDAVRARGLEIILLAHAAIKPFANPAGPDFNRYECKLAKGAAALVKEWSDAILFATYEEFVRRDAPRKGLSTGRRIIRTTRTAAYDAKNRTGLPDELPLDYSAYAAARAAGMGASLAALQAEADALLVTLNGSNPKAAEYVAQNRDNPERLAAAVNRLRTLIAHAADAAPTSTETTHA